MIKQFVKFLKDEDGVTSVEYAVMAALIALVNFKKFNGNSSYRNKNLGANKSLG